MSKRSTPHIAAAQAAFRHAREVDYEAEGASIAPLVVRIRRPAIAFVAGFPSAIGGIALAAALGRGGAGDGALPLGVGLLVTGAVLLVLGATSRLRLDDVGLTVRFFGLRSTRVDLADLSSATFGMTFPSISFAIALKDRMGRTARVHANWWRREQTIMKAVLRRLLDDDVAMDRGTARIVAQTLGVKRPKARVVHRALLRRDRTW